MRAWTGYGTPSAESGGPGTRKSICPPSSRYCSASCSPGIRSSGRACCREISPRSGRICGNVSDPRRRSHSMVTGHGKKRLLFVFKSVPYPVRPDGISARYLPIIEAVSRGSAIDLFVIDGRAEKESLLEGLKPYCRKIVHLKNPRRTRHGIFTKCMTYLKFLLPWTPPLSVVRHGGGAVTRGIIDAARGEHYDTVVLVGGELLPDLMN